MVDDRMMTNPSGQVWRSIDEAAAALGVCERTVRRRVERGEFTVQRVGGRVLVDIGGGAVPSVALASEARAVAEDARRSQATALVAFEQASRAFADVERRHVADLRAARRSRSVAWIAAGVAALVAFAAAWTAGKLSDTVDTLTVQTARAEEREQRAWTAVTDSLRAAEARQGVAAVAAVCEEPADPKPAERP